MKQLPVALHPIFWVEEAIALDGNLLKLVKTVFWILKIFDIIKYVVMGISLCGLAYTIYLYYKRKQFQKIVTVSEFIKPDSKNAEEIIIKSNIGSAKSVIK